MKKLLCVLLVLISMSAALAPAVFADTTFSITNPQGGALATPSVKSGSSISTSIGFMPSDPTFNLSLTADVITSTDVSSFPFEISQSNYTKTLSKNGDGVYVYDFNMKCRSDAAAGYYTISFKLKYNDGTDKESTVSVVMQVTAASTPSVPDNMPRITITAFSTSPDPVVAGEEITLSVTFTNNTAGVTAKNVKAQLSSDGTFTPVSGSSSMFLGNIGGSSSVRKSIKLKVKADVAPSSYAVTFSLTYDVAGVEGQMSDSETVSIPVVQVPKLQVSNPQMYPEEVYVGQDMNFMAALNNTGRSTLYNVNVAFEDAAGCIVGLEQYIGNIEPGETKNLDVYLSAIMEGEALLTMTITYEDQDSEIYTFTESYSLYVMTRGDVDPMPWPEEPEFKGGGFVWIIILVIILLAAGGLVAFILINRKKKAEKNKQLDEQQIAQMELEYSQQNIQDAGYAVYDMPPVAEMPKDVQSNVVSEKKGDNDFAEKMVSIARYNKQPAGESYFVDSDMSATTEIPVAEIEADTAATDVSKHAGEQAEPKSEAGETPINNGETGQSGETRA